MWSCRELGKKVVCEDGHTTGGNRTQDWDDIVEGFTTRDLTYLTDKLAAVEGISRIMQRSREDGCSNGV